MTFRVVHKPSNTHVRCPYRLVEQATGREIDWINKYLDYETLRRLADATLRTYAHELRPIPVSYNFACSAVSTAGLTVKGWLARMWIRRLSSDILRAGRKTANCAKVILLLCPGC